MVDRELRNWITYDYYEDAGHEVPWNVTSGLAVAEEAWEYAAEYYDWISSELRAVNQRLEQYYRIGQSVQVVFGIDIVSVQCHFNKLH